MAGALPALPPGYTLDSGAPPPIPAPPEGYVLDKWEAPNALTGVGAALAGNLAAAMQGTSPVVRGAEGRLNYQPLGKVIDSDGGPAYADAQGKWQLVDPTRHVILNDPGSGDATVFARSPATDERLASAGRLLGFGATAPSAVAVANLGGPAAAALRNRFGAPETQAANRVGAALRADVAASGPGPAQIAQGLTDAGGAPLNAMDVGGENLRGLAGQVARMPGPGRQQIMAALNGRDASAGPRLADAVNTMTGGGAGGNFLVERALNDQARSAAAPLYGQAYLAPALNPDLMAPDGALGKLMARPSMQQAAQRALTIAREEGRDPSTLGITFNEAGDPAFARVPSWQSLDLLKRGLDDTLNTFRDSTTGRLNLDEGGRAIDQTRRAYLSLLDENNPAYAAARAAYSGPQQSRGALLQGAQIFNKDPDQITSEVAALTPGDQRFYRLGAANTLKTQLAQTSSGGNEALRLMGNDYRQQQLRAVFPNADQLLGVAGDENRMFQTRQAVLGGSQTAARLAQDQGQSSGMLQPLAEAGTAILAHEPVLAAKSGLSALQAIFKGGAMTPEIGGKVAGALLQNDPMTARAWLFDAFNRASPPPVNLRPAMPLVDLSAQQLPQLQQ